MPVAAQNLAFVPRENVQLTSFLKSDVPELDVKAIAQPSPAMPPLPPPSAPPPAASGGAPPSTESRGCHGCALTPSAHDAGMIAALIALAALVARRRR